MSKKYQTSIIHQLPNYKGFDCYLVDEVPKVLCQFGFLNISEFDPAKRDPCDEKEVAVCKQFLSSLVKRKAINDERGSYGLKHDIEDKRRIYTTNGDCIKAMMELGFDLKVIGPNAFFNYTTKSYNAFLTI